ncbi:MAG: hypothetical protein HY784_05565 [Chloroflexi bacterium]|nr:hypothetical protein [Chloroflexota bacterium]
MYQSDAEMLFPSRVIPHLRALRGPVWQALIDRLSGAGEGDEDDLAFGLMMIRLDGCLTCHADSYRAMRGCTTCAQQTIARFKGSDEELLQRFDWARRDVLCYLAEGRVAAD